MPRPYKGLRGFSVGADLCVRPQRKPGGPSPTGGLYHPSPNRRETRASEPGPLVLRTANVPVHLLTAGVPRRSSMQPQTHKATP